jgi:hypothetical protein
MNACLGQPAITSLAVSGALVQPAFRATEKSMELDALILTNALWGASARQTRIAPTQLGPIFAPACLDTSKSVFLLVALFALTLTNASRKIHATHVPIALIPLVVIPVRASQVTPAQLAKTSMNVQMELKIVRCKVTATTPPVRSTANVLLALKGMVLLQRFQVVLAV